MPDSGLAVSSLFFDILEVDPSSPVEGQIWYNTTGKVLKSYQAGQIQPVVAKLNITASTDPGPSNDSSQGYSLGSRWFNTISNNEYICINASVGAAVWRLTTVTTSSSLVDGLISGGAAWDSGLVFNVTALQYVIGGTYYTSPGGQVTLNTADPSNPRIDIIVADTTRAVTKITGTPAASPVKPSIGINQVEVTFVTVPANSSTPSVTTTNVYLENAGIVGGEWDATTNAAARINLASTVTPYQGTKDIEATNPVSGDQIYLDPSGTFNGASISILEFAIRAKSGWGSSYLYMCFESPDGFPNGSWVYIAHGRFGFDSTNTTSYQIISIPISNFYLNSPSSITRLRFYFVQSGSPSGFFLDRIRLQTSVPVYYVSNNDNNAIHRNIANEINSITIKSAPVAGDLFIIEDSQASFLKKKVQLSAIGQGISLDYQYTSSESTVTTTSTTDVLLTGMSLTASRTGTYRIIFSCDWSGSSSSLTATYSAYLAGVKIANSNRPQRVTAGGAFMVTMFETIASVTAGQTIDIRWSVSTGTGTTYERYFSVIRVA